MKHITLLYSQTHQHGIKIEDDEVKKNNKKKEKKKKRKIKKDIKSKKPKPPKIRGTTTQKNQRIKMRTLDFDASSKRYTKIKIK